MPKKRSVEKRRLLLFAGDNYCRYFLDEVLHLDELSIVQERSFTDVCDRVQKEVYDAVLLNIETSRNELGLVGEIHRINEQVPIIVISESPDLDFAIESIRAGALDYLPRPFNNISRVEKSLDLAFKKTDESAETEKAVEYAKKNHGIFGSSDPLRMLLHTVSQVAPLDISVLITGESGTGKELIARAVHVESGRAPETFVAFNCGAIPDGLVESILFGHQKGAFTGAEKDHAGYVEKAKGGTLFLDEVGELSMKAQATLLRFLQEREYVRVGGERKMISDARVIASTNRDLEQDVDRKIMRADLYFRLNVVHMKVPPLRERGEDILILADHFARRFCAANGLPVRTFSAGAARLLMRHDWPGNVRELMNMINGILATTRGKKGVLAERDLTAYSERLSQVAGKSGAPASGDLATMTYRAAQEAFESSYFKNLLASHGGNVWLSAQSASIHPVTLRRKMAQLGLKQEK